jgi:hypothetical protein
MAVEFVVDVVVVVDVVDVVDVVVDTEIINH